MKNLKDKIKKIKLIILDVDGVLTDGGLIVGHDGFEYIKFNVQDGAGIIIAQKMGYRFAIITGRNTKIVAKRASMLKIKDVFQGRIFKIEAYLKLKKKYKLQDQQICYMGDDILDIPVLEKVGLAVAPKNAVKEVKRVAHYITNRSGGDGAVREMIDLVLDQTGKKKKLIEQVRKQTLPIRKLS
jgi:3-deoxy-D-manno-octulosonate 8-phosphate phosphatase (KDO 8-P phosphatase)